MMESASGVVATSRKRLRPCTSYEKDDEHRRTRARALNSAPCNRPCELFIDVVCDDIGRYRLHPFLCDSDAVHLLQTARAVYEYHCVRPYRLKCDTLTPTSARLISASGPVDMTALTDFSLRITADDEQIHIAFPRSLTRLHFSSPYIYQLAEGALPAWLTELSFGKDVVNLFASKSLPASLRTLTLYDDWHNSWEDLPMCQPVTQHLTGSQTLIPQGFLPKSLTELQLNGAIAVTDLPATLKRLRLDLRLQPFSFANFALPSLTDLHLKHFVRSSSGEMFPPSLLHLQVDSNDHLISIASLPKALVTCIVPGLSDITADSKLPSRLLRLSLARGAYALLTFALIPATLTSLTIIGSETDAPIGANLLPPTLTQLKLIGGFNQPIAADALPSSLNHLTLSNRWTHDLRLVALPPRLLLLDVDDEFGEFDYTIHPTKNILPPTLTSLTLTDKFDQPLLHRGMLPAALRHIIFGRSFNQKIDVDVLPNTLISIQFGRNFNRPLTQRILPKSLRVLVFPSDSLFRQQIAFPCEMIRIELGGAHIAFDVNVLPESLTHFTSAINRPLSSLRLPSKLIRLELSSFDQSIGAGELPASLTWLRLDSFRHDLTEDCLPATLKHLILTNYSGRLTRAMLPPNLIRFTAPYQYRICATGRLHFTSKLTL